MRMDEKMACRAAHTRYPKHRSAAAEESTSAIPYAIDDSYKGKVQGQLVASVQSIEYLKVVPPTLPIGNPQGCSPTRFSVHGPRERGPSFLPPSLNPPKTFSVYGVCVMSQGYTVTCGVDQGTRTSVNCGIQFPHSTNHGSFNL